MPKTSAPQLIRELALLHRQTGDPRFIAAAEAIKQQRILDNRGRWQRTEFHPHADEAADIAHFKLAEEFRRLPGVTENLAYARVVAESERIVWLVDDHRQPKFDADGKPMTRIEQGLRGHSFEAIIKRLQRCRDRWTSATPHMSKANRNKA